jgi:hypothetical protein
MCSNKKSECERRDSHKLYIDNFFSSPDITMTCTQEVSTVVGLADKIIRECPRNLDKKTLKLIQVDICARMRVAWQQCF